MPKAKLFNPFLICSLFLLHFLAVFLSFSISLVVYNGVGLTRHSRAHSSNNVFNASCHRSLLLSLLLPLFLFFLRRKRLSTSPHFLLLSLSVFSCQVSLYDMKYIFISQGSERMLEHPHHLREKG